MNENGNKKREWVKTAAIIFLSVMLVLTFFSNTIMNYSLPEVATQYVTSGTITARIRGTGIVESGDPYEVKVTQSRKVSSVAVRVGDEVQKGDVLLYLEDSESEELEAAKQELEAAQDALEDAREAYDQALLSADVTAEGIQAANGNTSTAAYRRQLTNAQNAVKEAQKKVDDIEAWQDSLNRQIAINEGTSSNLEDETKAFEDAKAALEEAKRTKEQQDIAVQSAEAEIENLDRQLLQVSGNDVAAEQGLKDKLAAAQKKLASAQNAQNDVTVDLARKQAAYDNASLALENKRKEIADDLNSQSLYSANDLAVAKKDLEDKQKALSDLTTMLTTMFNLDSQQEAIADAQKLVDKAQEKVEEETAKAIGATVTADIAGTVTAINVTAGNTTNALDPVVVLQPEGKGYTLSFSVTNDQARRVNVGDRADLVNAWRYDDVNLVLASIKPDTSDPGQKKLLTFDVSGSVVAGQSFNVSVGQQSANFDYIVPNSAIREDSNGKFILIVEAKPSPLSTRYKATRVDVEVIASDDSQSAISGAALYGYEPVITTSTQPVEAGQLVRLANN